MSDRARSLGAAWRVRRAGEAPSGAPFEAFLKGLVDDAPFGTEDILGLLDPKLFCQGPLGWKSLDKKSRKKFATFTSETPWFRSDDWRLDHLKAWRLRYVNRMPYSAISSALGITRRAAVGRVQKVNAFLIKMSLVVRVLYSFQREISPVEQQRMRDAVDEAREKGQDFTVPEIMDKWNTSPSTALHVLKREWNHSTGKLSSADIERLVSGDLKKLGYRMAGKKLGVSPHTVRYHRKKAEKSEKRRAG